MTRKTGRTKRAETTEVIDLETGSSEVSTVTQNESKHNDSENDDDDELEMEIDYKLVIKQADGSALPENNITALLKDDEINANDYNISFKSEKAQGAGTLLVDVCDFKNFRLEYVKLAAAKRTMLILVTMRKKEKLVKRKKKVKFILYFFYYTVFLKNY